MIDAVFLSYVAQLSLDELSEDSLKEALAWLRSPRKKTTDNALLKGFVEALRRIDPEDLSEDFKHARLTLSLKEWRESAGSVALAAESARFCEAVTGKPAIVIQSACELAPDDREGFRKKHPGEYVVFRTDRNLLGGSRRIGGGSVKDESWAAHVKRIFYAKKPSNDPT